MTRPRITSFTTASGFTLIEVMVSAAILAIVLAVIYVIVTFGLIPLPELPGG